MQLENLVIDARDPRGLGGFWAAALGAEPITEGADIFEARLRYSDDQFLDLCFPLVDEPAVGTPRLHPDLAGGVRQGEVVERLLGQGAARLDIGQGDVPWVVLADPEGNPFCVMEERAEYADRGPLAALPLDSADPARDLAFWAMLTGWEQVVGGSVPATLSHPSGLGPLLELCSQVEPKVRKNRMHLDLRYAADDDPADWARRIEAAGGSRYDPGWGEVGWELWRDPSGNEFCLLPAS